MKKFIGTEVFLKYIGTTKVGHIVAPSDTDDREDRICIYIDDENRTAVFPFPEIFSNLLITNDEKLKEYVLEVTSIKKEEVKSKKREEQLKKEAEEKARHEKEQEAREHAVQVIRQLEAQEEHKRKKAEEERKARYYKQQNAYNYLTNVRGVKQLVHFTPVNNIKSILEIGILPRSEVPDDAVTLDSMRIDGRRGCCLSVSFPNYKMFYSKRNEYIDQYEFAVLGISPAIIKDTDVSKVFFYDDNAAGYRRNKHTGTYGAACMFSDLDQPDSGSRTFRKEAGLPGNYTTNPQAEVQIHASIPPQYIDCVYVETEQQKYRLTRILGKSSDVEILVNREMFSGRFDCEYWEK